jgi:hypothetical protein
MPRPLDVAAAAGALALGAMALTPGGADASGCPCFVSHNSSPASQVVLGNNTGRIFNSTGSQQAIGDPGSHGNLGTIRNDTDSVQVVGTAPGANHNEGTLSGTVGAFQSIGTLPGERFNEGVIRNSVGSVQNIGTVSFLGVPTATNHNEAFIENGDSNTFQQVLQNGSFNTLRADGPGIGQDIQASILNGAFADHNELTARGSSISQQVFGLGVANRLDGNELTAGGGTIFQGLETLGTGSLVNHNDLSARGVFITQTVIEDAGGASRRNLLTARGSNILQTVTDGSGNELSAKGSHISISVTNGNRNDVNVRGSQNTVTITGTLGAPADNNQVFITGTGDTVMLTGLSNQKVVIRGNGITCHSTCTM